MVTEPWCRARLDTQSCSVRTRRVGTTEGDPSRDGDSLEGSVVGGVDVPRAEPPDPPPARNGASEPTVTVGLVSGRDRLARRIETGARADAARVCDGCDPYRARVLARLRTFPADRRLPRGGRWPPHASHPSVGSEVQQTTRPHKGTCSAREDQDKIQRRSAGPLLTRRSRCACALLSTIDRLRWRARA